MKLTVQELALIIEILNTRSTANNQLKDLRMIDSLVTTLTKYMPPQPELPTDGTDDSKNLYKQQCEDYHKQEIEVSLHEVQLTVIRIKLSSTNVFYDDKATRDKIIPLAVKLGI
jgi:hypothetical protein